MKNASRLWGYHDTEAESAFDPLVGLLMGTLAFELEKISGEIQNSESRVVEKLVALLTPEPVTGASPAHAVLSAQPNQAVFEIHPGNQFYYSRKINSPGDAKRTEQQNVFFTPAGSYKLINGRVRYLSTERTFYEMDDEGYRDAIAESDSTTQRDGSKFWIGIDLAGNPENFDGLTLFFDLKSEPNEDVFYQSLARASFSLNEKPVRFANGYGPVHENMSEPAEVLASLDPDTTTKVCRHVNRLYRKKFMALFDDSPAKTFQNAGMFPPSLLRYFSEQSLKMVKTQCVWIRIDFGQSLTSEVLENVYCHLNCFPVINRQLNKFTHSAREFINIIPLKSDAAFFDMSSVTNSRGIQYAIKPFAKSREIEQGAYLFRQGGVARFDTRNAVEFLNYLIELLREENAAFTGLGADMIAANLREVNQVIARLENRLKDTSHLRETISYLMVRALPQDETVYVEFWSTLGAAANNIKPGTLLTVNSGSDFLQKSILLHSPSFGGRDKMDTEDRLNAYRRALLSRDRIVTSEDIRALCFEYFGKFVSQVTVSKGVSMGATTDSGFIRTVDVKITLIPQPEPYSAEELKFMKEDIAVKLEERSMNMMPYRILLL